jgi:hypothetical protein
MSQMLPVTGEDIENKRQQLLAALAALPAVGVGVDKPLLRSIQEKDPSEWGDDEWDAANARELLTPELKAQYAVRLLQRRQAAERRELLSQYQGGNIPGLGQATHEGLLAGQLPVREGTQGEPPSPDDLPYEEDTRANLQAEVKARNETRADEDKIRPASDRKDDLVAALYKDDEEHPS